MIEIIAVLILIGILAAVAVPKFLSMQKDAELKSVAGVKMELSARANQYFARYLLDRTLTQNNQTAGNWANTGVEDIGADFDLIAGGGGTYLRVRVMASNNYYRIAFTRGVNATDDTGSPAVFGAITAE